MHSSGWVIYTLPNGMLKWNSINCCMLVCKDKLQRLLTLHSFVRIDNDIIYVKWLKFISKWLINVSSMSEEFVEWILIGECFRVEFVHGSLLHGRRSSIDCVLEMANIYGANELCCRSNNIEYSISDFWFDSWPYWYYQVVLHRFLVVSINLLSSNDAKINVKKTLNIIVSAPYDRFHSFFGFLLFYFWIIYIVFGVFLTYPTYISIFQSQALYIEAFTRDLCFQFTLLQSNQGHEEQNEKLIKNIMKFHADTVGWVSRFGVLCLLKFLRIFDFW